MTASDKSHEVLRALSALAKSSRLSINELRIVLALERIVARIEAHAILREKLIFKGGFVLYKILESERFTRDLDALAKELPREGLSSWVSEALQNDLDDGVYFATPQVENLTDQGPYGGYRFRIPFQIGPLPVEERKLKKLSRVHLDVGFGDVIFGRARRPEFAMLLKNEQPLSWTVYPLESIFAEKLETFVSRASGNSRAKDLYDLIKLFAALQSEKSLVSAARRTFDNRRTILPESFEAFFVELDLSILERSWGSVELAGTNMNFEDCKKRLRIVMRALDLLLEVEEEGDKS